MTNLRRAIPLPLRIFVVLPAARTIERPSVQHTISGKKFRSFNVTPDVWLPGVDGSDRAGLKAKAADVNFIDNSHNLSSVPNALLMRFEANSGRFGLHLEGVYSHFDFKEKTDATLNVPFGGWTACWGEGP